MDFTEEGLRVFRQSRTLNQGIMALIHKGTTDAAPLCDSIKRVQKFTGQGLTQVETPDKIQTSTTKKELK